MKIPKSEKLQPKDYGEESANGSGIQPDQTEDEIIIVFEENQRIEKLLYNTLSDVDKAIYYAGYKSATQKAQQEVDSLQADIVKTIIEKAKLTVELSEKDKQIKSLQCCGNCDQENLQAICLITSEDITRHNYKCANWKQK